MKFIVLEPHRLKKLGVMLLIFMLGGITSIGALGGTVYYKVNKTVSSVFAGGSEAAETAPAISQKIESVKRVGDGRINFLIVGFDSPGHIRSRTDTIMLASVNPETGHTSLFSLPRDLWVPNVKALSRGSKINTIWMRAEKAKKGTGEKTLRATIEDIMDLNVHYFIGVNWHGFVKFIDAIGGVTVDVPYALRDYTNSIDIPSGVQRLTGGKALQFVRCRKNTCQRDFGRQERQQLLIEAVIKKIQKNKIYLNPIKVFKIMDAVGNNVRTDIGQDQMLEFGDLIGIVNPKKIETRVLADGYGQPLVSGHVYPDGSVLKTASGNFDLIRRYVHEVLDDPFLQKENAKIVLEDATKDPAKFKILAQTLKSYGYRIIGAKKAKDNFKSSVIIDYTKGKKKYTLKYLELKFGVTAVPGDRTGGVKADILVIVGSNDLFDDEKK